MRNSPAVDSMGFSERPVTLDAVVQTAQLYERARHPRNHLISMPPSVGTAQYHPAAVGILQQLVETAAKPYPGASVGISIMEEYLGADVFRWHALTGPLSLHRWGTTPRDFGPCGTVIDRKAAQLMILPERHFAYLSYIKPRVLEVLLVPFWVHGQLVGTIWIVSHDPDLKFDSGDLQACERMGTRAADAYERAPSVALSKAGDRRANGLRASLAIDLRGGGDAPAPHPDAVSRAISLVQRMRAGDQNAFNELHVRTCGRLQALARAILRNSEDAEEVVIETYAQAWRQAERYDPTRATPLGWLVTICRSRALDRRRRNRVRDAAKVRDQLAFTDGSELPDEFVSLFYEGSRVRKALASLTPQRQRFLGLAFFEGLSTEEMAQRMKTPVGTVKTHIRRGIAELRRALLDSSTSHE
ncbi:MAG TPA: sigma-70 family RNA polymerase sigma factor [Steroidobacteraceae bacterium]|nr:sigma-70 family RNA polymerase sigma factor [Steroidobacteraceae bacterium]